MRKCRGEKGDRRTGDGRTETDGGYVGAIDVDAAASGACLSVADQ